MAEVVEKLVLQENFPSVLRDVFNGVYMMGTKRYLQYYTNHVGDRPVYYYFIKIKCLFQIIITC